MPKKPHPSIASHTATMGEKKRIGLVAHDYRLRAHDRAGAEVGDEAALVEVLVALHQLLHEQPSDPLAMVLGVDQDMREVDHQMPVGDGVREPDQLAVAAGGHQGQPHDVDVKALLRICVVYNIPLACSRSSADFLISSELLDKPYERFLVDYGERLRNLKVDE